jgi:2-dehydropantoate 2-reductase
MQQESGPKANESIKKGQRMNIAVIGAGAIGSVVAARLAKAGKDVTLVAKDEQVDAIAQKGITVRQASGDGSFKEETVEVKAVPRLDQEHDLVIFTVKTQDLERAYQANHEYLETPMVLTTQNGVQADNILSVHFEREKMMSSIVMFGATYTQPGKVTLNFDGDWVVGRPFLPVGPQARAVADELAGAFDVKVSRNIMGMKWLKLFVNFNNCIPALVGKSMQETFADLDLCRLSVRLLREGWDIVHKANIELVSLPDFPVDRTESLVTMPEDQAAGILNAMLTNLSDEPLYGSILQSILRKRPSEIDFINGEVCCLARQMRQKAPLNDTILDMVHTVENTGKFYSIDEVKKAFDLG